MRFFAFSETQSRKVVSYLNGSSNFDDIREHPGYNSKTLNGEILLYKRKQPFNFEEYVFASHSEIHFYLLNL